MAIIFDGQDQRHTAARTTSGEAGSLVKDTDAARFVADVIDASFHAPVLVDFWAPWCEPCKTLGPLLEKLVHQAKGAVRMVKVNIDQSRALAAQFRIQSVPAVYAFRDGRPVDGFVGALPESQIKAFIKRLSGADNPLEMALEEAKVLVEAGDIESSLALYQQILTQDPSCAAAAAGIVTGCLALGNVVEARAFLEQVPDSMRSSSDMRAAQTRLELAEEAGRGEGAVHDLESRVAASPGDHQARYDLAMAYVAADRRQDAANALLDIIRMDRTWNDEQARHQLLKLFEAFGHADPVTVHARRQLSSLLFS
ncbi:co-chaperone YbbN [Haematospirillum jordaniae]|uniref:Thioredoxin domain-containing protein n=1 Tax=Haematospirillum jordaniae TaxID=1549855 RepID=A0A143DCB6_9PROT|nr:co-chaperone YbbN [Haematospirillum jordaniae]AMW34374.1 hypothetical protein AY555_03305 [Haematospirillum jordaniae]NKD44653.1 co-chaperone YbbN [Haematospirillum jordaniae]NKD57673.1 co-chaperone YbbN [Haematospirillum jordaniae]NKD59243.1 co-chaperone YbbN [Haematospirillum jordaniae]NKD67381.1 co-chaperone YbbN [Haematospirillum jordaniae]